MDQLIPSAKHRSRKLWRLPQTVQELDAYLVSRPVQALRSIAESIFTYGALPFRRPGNGIVQRFSPVSITSVPPTAS
jgi:hypothetical protein